MLLLLHIGVISLAVGSSAEITCRKADGSPVDWYVGYKMPKTTVVPKQNGDEFLYADKVNPSWSAPEDITSANSSVGQTLKQYYQMKTDPDVFYMMYSDAYPDGTSDSYRGHTKGVVLFDDKTGFWLIHSLPKFPDPDEYIFPSSGYTNGQSFLCITFHTDVLTALADHFWYTMPSIYASQLPMDIAADYPVLQKVIAKTSLPTSIKVYSKVQEVMSLGNSPFTVYGKHKKFDADLYADLVAPHSHCSLYAETWQNGAGNPYPSNCDSSDGSIDVNNIDSVNVNNVPFASSKDHSKWAVAENVQCGFVCIGDINRVMSQNSRAGGTVCFKNLPIWFIYHQSVVDIEECPINV